MFGLSFLGWALIALCGAGFVLVLILIGIGLLLPPPRRMRWVPRFDEAIRRPYDAGRDPGSFRAGVTEESDQASGPRNEDTRRE